MSNYSPSVHTSKMDKIKSKQGVNSSMNYNNNISNTKQIFDLLRNNADTNESVYEEQVNIQDSVKSIKNYMDYMNNKAKVYDPITNSYLISALNCNSVENAMKEFRDTEKLYHSHKKENLSKNKTPNEAFRLYINFNGKDIPADKVHKISTEIAKRICGGDYKAVISTHTNTDHFHSHILINAYNNDGYHKLHEELKIGLKWQQISNMVALENGCDIMLSFKDTHDNTDILNSNDIDNDIIDTENINDTKRTRHFKKKNEYDATKFHKQIGKITLQDTINKYLEPSNILKYDIKNYNNLVNTIYRNTGFKTIKNKNDKQNLWYKENFNDIFGIDKSTNEQKSFIRESRLGYQYTETYINKYIKQIQNENEIEYKYNKIKHIDFVKTSRDKIMIYKKPFLFLLIQMVINIIKYLFENQTKIIIKNNRQESIVRENFKLLKQKQKYYENLLSKLETYNILAKDNNYNNYKVENIFDLQIAKNNAYKELKQLQFETKNRFKTKNINSLLQAIDNIKTNLNLINKYNLYDIISNNIENANIRENIAKLNPLTPKTKSILYNVMQKSGFVLKYHYNELTEEQARNIISFINNNKKVGNNFPLLKTDTDTKSGKQFPTFPQELYTLKEYITLKKQGKLTENTKKSMQEYNLKQYNEITEIFKNQNHITDNEYKIITKLKPHITKLKSFGLKNLNDIDTLYNELQNLNDINNIKQNRLRELKSNLTLYNEIEQVLNGEYANKFKPLINLIDTDNLTEIHNLFLKKFNTKTEQYIAIKNLLDINRQEINIALKDNNLVLAPIEFKLIIKFIASINDTELTESDINQMQIEQIKEMIENFLKQYDTDIANQTLNLNNEIEQEYYKDIDNRNKIDAKILSDFNKENAKNYNLYIKNKEYITEKTTYQNNTKLDNSTENIDIKDIKESLNTNKNTKNDTDTPPNYDPNKIYRPFND